MHICDEVKSFSGERRGYTIRQSEASVVFLGFEEDLECHSSEGNMMEPDASCIF